ncbi:MAG: hypothetical protein C0522_08435, partial [Rhodocyclaceae bacterium]|nr:hypothetical protein [Rhodocyclaceae bacterium]
MSDYLPPTPLPEEGGGFGSLRSQSLAGPALGRPGEGAVPILRTKELTKRFGGLTAVDKVSLDLHIGEVHAVIGPNGAGKSTLTNLLSGDLPPTSGEVVFEGSDIAGLSSDRISRLGIGRSYQKTNIFLPFSVFDNCRLAAQSRTPHAWRVFHRAPGFNDINRLAAEAMEAA